MKLTSSDSSLSRKRTKKVQCAGGTPEMGTGKGAGQDTRSRRLCPLNLGPALTGHIASELIVRNEQRQFVGVLSSSGSENC